MSKVLIKPRVLAYLESDGSGVNQLFYLGKDCVKPTSETHATIELTDETRPKEGPAARAQVFRFKDWDSVQLSLILRQNHWTESVFSVSLGIDSISQLITALNDALIDAKEEADRQALSASLAEIREELRDAGDRGTGVYYGHPWVFYVAPGQSAAKAKELSAQGMAEFVVLEDESFATPEPAEASAS
ncbi:hypothetical protein [Paucibacter sp. Y2R2-4]|uniref:hypothetical protein n=1 Tax=Paucibacter sp. Y2R2-4 TaxID=2893553 RepID=UPI0021E48B56|nr:hypothetical protein [Paucibacter sp. Y2R2-4]MCV2349320.1 hypothetical protein [Paucibacter sp. Y2R2-4]